MAIGRTSLREEPRTSWRPTQEKDIQSYGGRDRMSTEQILIVGGYGVVGSRVVRELAFARLLRRGLKVEFSDFPRVASAGSQ